MLGPGELDEAVAGPRGLLSGIDCCIQARCLVPALTVLFSAIDVVSALTRPMNAPDTNKGVFQAWVATYMSPFLTATGCSAEDIYAARCGVVHTMSRSSRLSRTKPHVKTLVYHWRGGPRPDATAPPANGALQICVEDLHEAFRDGLARFGAARAQGGDLAARIAHHEPELLCYRPWSSVKVRAA